jgi:predicted DNA-binding protein with PD1-like motif
MKYSQCKQGRVFVIRLEDGDIVHTEIENLARNESIKAATMIIIGGADSGSKLVAGPVNGRQSPVQPLQIELDDVHEIVGTGTIFPDADGNPILHMHIACGRETETRTGCIRQGVKVWQVMEVILFELVETTGMRVLDPVTGFELLKP